MLKRALAAVVAVLCLQAGFPGAVAVAAEAQEQVRELNFVYLHGAGGTSCSMQMLADAIDARLSGYTLGYEQGHPGVRIQSQSFLRCYPNTVDLEAWAANIADNIDRYFGERKNLVLIGHSMGGKSALYAVAKNVGNLADKVAMVVTINSPIKSLRDYYVSGSASLLEYYRALGMVADTGFSGSTVYYDSSEDGRQVASTKRWLALISAEPAPLSPLFDTGGVDPFPRDMDDLIVPISAQHAEGADVFYYGEHSHSDFHDYEEVAGDVAEQILRYIFGGALDFSRFAGSGSFQRQADWFPGTDVWEDIVAEAPATSGTVEHFNPSFFRWQEYEDIVGECLTQEQRSSFYVTPTESFPIFAAIQEVRWLNAHDPDDCRLYIRTRLAPRNSIRLDWRLSQEGLMAAGLERAHYEVEILVGTPFTAITDVAWASDNPSDIRLRIVSEAQSPFRWYQAIWRAYYRDTRERGIIDELG